MYRNTEYSCGTNWGFGESFLKEQILGFLGKIIMSYQSEVGQ